MYGLFGQKFTASVFEYQAYGETRKEEKDFAAGCIFQANFAVGTD